MNDKTNRRKPTRDLQLGPQPRLRALVLLVLTIAGIYLCLWLVLPFLPALVWALALAILFVPAHRRVEIELNSPSIAAAISVFFIGLVIVVPVILISGRVVQVAAEGSVTVKDKWVSAEWRQALESNELLAPLAHWTERLDLQPTLEQVTTWLTTTSASFVTGSVLGLLSLLVTFYLLFYFLRDRKLALSWLREMSPLSSEETNRLFARIIDTVEATIYGTVAIALMQGVLGGFIFWLLDLPQPVLWGLVMGALAIIPVLGAFVIWIPVAVFLALSGDWSKALMLTAWGVIVVGGIDNLLYPILVKNRMRLHTIPAFLSIMGGLLLFGASGLLLGPLVVTITMFFLETWRVPVARPDL